MADPVAKGLDHLLIGVRQLELARETWERLGFTLTPRGRHIGWGTANYCIMFDQDYIELLGIIDPSQFSNNLDRFLEEREGALGLAYATEDADAAAKMLRARGVAIDGPRELKRVLELRGGDALPEFRLVHLPAEVSAGIRSFLVQHLSRDLVWQQQWISHPNTAVGIHGLGIAVEAPEATAHAYCGLWGEGARLIEANPAISTIAHGSLELQFMAPKVAYAFFDSRPAIPFIAEARIAVEEANAAKACFLRSKIGFQDGGHMVSVSPDDANGIYLTFEEFQNRRAEPLAEVIELDRFRRK